jgi:Ca2+-binding RTX toxin-like protein
VACFEVLVAEDTYNEGEGAVVRRGHLITVVETFLIGCAVLLLVVGCSGVRTGAPQEKQQGHTEATREQGRSPEATASEEARCEGTRTYRRKTGDMEVYTTNDLPGCPKGGLLLGTDKSDAQPDHTGLDGKDGDDKIRGLGGSDYIEGGSGDDVIYGGDGDDYLDGVGGKDVIYGGDGNDSLIANDGQRDKLYCGKGKDRYMNVGDKIDYVDSSCEKKMPPPPRHCCAAHRRVITA